MEDLECQEIETDEGHRTRFRPKMVSKTEMIKLAAKHALPIEVDIAVTEAPRVDLDEFAKLNSQPNSVDTLLAEAERIE